MRMPNYLYKRVEDFAEGKAVNVSEAIRFIFENHTEELEEAQNVKRLIKGLDS
jgi:predicted DNA-binding protein